MRSRCGQRALRGSWGTRTRRGGEMARRLRRGHRGGKTADRRWLVGREKGAFRKEGVTDHFRFSKSILCPAGGGGR